MIAPSWKIRRTGGLQARGISASFSGDSLVLHSAGVHVSLLIKNRDEVAVSLHTIRILLFGVLH